MSTKKAKKQAAQKSAEPVQAESSSNPSTGTHSSKRK